MIIFAKRLIERPTEGTLDGIVRNLRYTLCQTTERILDQILTYMVAVLQKR